jgi:hypothetical protein
LGVLSKVVFGVLFVVYTVMKCNWSPAAERAPADRSPFSTRLLIAFICLCVWPAIPLLAQNAQLSGLIRDPANLAVPRAKVAVQSADTAATRTVSSNQQGEYSVAALLPGPYNITI